MHKKNIITKFLAQLTSIGAGMRIAAGTLTACVRTGTTLFMLFLFSATLLLYYFDIIHRTIFAGASSLAWALLKIIKQWGITLPMHVFGVEWLVHFPEFFLLLSLIALLSLMMVHVTNNSLINGACGVGRAFFRAMGAWRFIVAYAVSMSIMIWMFGDVHINCVRWMLSMIHGTPAMMQSLYDPEYGTKMIELILNAPFWLSMGTRLAISVFWYLATFLLFPIAALEEASFIVALRRSCLLMLRNPGLVISAALFYLIMQSGIIVATIYGEAATLPSLAGLGVKSSVQAVVLVAFMTLILCTVHAALVATGSLIAGVCIYRMVMHQGMPLLHPLYTKRPYWSCCLYLLFYIFYWIVIRCGIHVQMPKI
jgi:hypothetical protein